MIHWLKIHARQTRFARKTAHVETAPLNLTLDIGCGSFPVPGADFAADLAYRPFDLVEMQVKLHGRFVRCDICHLPFASAAFGFVHCSNVLEHIADPERAFFELERVGRHGFAETPSFFFEQVVNHSSRHRWIVAWKDARLILHRVSGFKLWGREVYLFSSFSWWMRRHIPLLWKGIMYILDVGLDLAYNKYRW